MKRILIFTSLLALCACGGGGHSGITQPRAATALGSTYTVGENTEITPMATAVMVSDDLSYVNVARESTAPDNMSFDGYTLYKLNNVDFKIMEDATSQTATFSFGVGNDGRIKNVLATIKDKDFYAERGTGDDSDKLYGRVFRLIAAGNTEVLTIPDDGNITQQNLVSAKYNAIMDATNAGDTDLANTITAAVWKSDIQEFTLDHSNTTEGLTYSDFGFVNVANVKRDNSVTNPVETNEIDIPRESVVNAVFAGGYGIPNTPVDGMEFTGKAVGIVTTKNAGVPDKAILTTPFARLVYNNNNEVLYMPFASDGVAKDANSGAAVGWYDVRVTKTGANTANFEFITPTDTNITTRFARPDDTLPGTTINTTVDMGYYGVGTPSEATGAVEYLQQHTSGDEFRFQAAYGLKN